MKVALGQPDRVQHLRILVAVLHKLRDDAAQELSLLSCSRCCTRMQPQAPREHRQRQRGDGQAVLRGRDFDDAARRRRRHRMLRGLQFQHGSGPAGVVPGSGTG